MAFKDKDEFLDKLYDHIFPEAEYPDGPDEDDEGFFDHVAKFFDQLDEGSGGTGSGSGSGSGSGGGTNAPRRRRKETTTTPRRRRRAASSSGDTGYGNRTFFGTS